MKELRGCIRMKQLVFEFVLFDKLVTSSYVDKYQFGFKAKHSTGPCINVLKHTIDYYTMG